VRVGRLEQLCGGEEHLAGLFGREGLALVEQVEQLGDDLFVVAVVAVVVVVVV